MANSELSLIKPEERTLDGNLLPEVRERIIQEIKTHLQQTGYLNVSEISSKLGLSRQTTRRLIDEIVRVWNDESRNQFMAQIQWYQATLRDIEAHPRSYSKEKINLIKLKSSLLSKVNSLRKVLIIKK
ncbi:MAG: hypothetical protein V1778_05280 [bacterium]